MGKKARLDGIDLSVLFLESLENNYLRQIRKHIESAGMQLAMITSYPDFTHPESAERMNQINREKEYIKAAGLLGAQMIRVTSGQAHPGLKEGDGIQWALEGLLACESTAREAGVKMVSENHGKPGCWRYTDFDQQTHIFLALVEGIRGSSIEVNFDTANPVVYGDNPLGALEKVIDKVYSIHAADTKTKGVLNHVLLGTGLVPFKELFSYLKKSGFDGWICMEENSRLAERGVKAAAAFIQKQWRDA